LPSFTVTGPGGITDTVGAPGEGGGHQRVDGDTTTKDIGLAMGTPSPWGYLEHGEDISTGMGISLAQRHLQHTENTRVGDATTPGASRAHAGHEHGDGDGDTTTSGASGAHGGHRDGDIITPGAPEVWRGCRDGENTTRGGPRAHEGCQHGDGDGDTTTLAAHEDRDRASPATSHLAPGG